MEKAVRRIVTVCSFCDSKFKVSEALVGEKRRCTQCGRLFQVEDLQVRRRPPQYDGRACPMVGRLALKYKLLTEKQLDGILVDYKLQQKNDPDLELGDYLVQGGLISSVKMDILRAAEKNWKVWSQDKKFGAIAVQKGLATPKQIEDALVIQAKKLKAYSKTILMGDILVLAGVITPEQKQMILDTQQRLKTDAAQPDDLIQFKLDQFTDGGKQTAGKISDRPDTDTEDESSDIDSAAEEPSSLFDLKISADGVEAHLRKTEQCSEAVTPDDVKNFLQENLITWGIVDDAMIQGFLKSDIFRQKWFKVAAGISAEPGQNAFINYSFEKNHLKSGTVKSEGVIDFKSRGEIPHVLKGTLIAKKTVMKPSKQGVDVFGNAITVAETKDVKLMRGSGTAISDDGLSVYADIDGQPQVSFGGKISVFPELNIQGDVGYKTGHVDFDGNIHVSGIVQNGFHVKGAALFAQEICGAEVEVTGDVIVLGGIIDSEIRAQGQIKARYIKKSRINTFGNVTAAKEIIDSTVENSGSCCVTEGAVVSSVITSREGFAAVNIGTDVSRPCTLKVGVDDHMVSQIEMLRNAVLNRQEECEVLETQMQQLQQSDQEHQKRIVVLAQVQDRSTLAQRELTAELQTLSRQEPASEELARKRQELEHLKIKARTAEKELEHLFAEQDRFALETEKLQKRLLQLQENIEDLTIEKQAMTRWLREEKGNPVVKAGGAILAGTILSGAHCRKVVEHSVRNVTVRETRIADPDSAFKWEMVMADKP